MKIAIRKLVDSSEPLGRIAQEKMAGKLARVMSRNLRLISNELTDFNQARQKLLDQYGKPNDNGTQYEFNVEDGSSKKFADELNATLDDEVELDIRLLTEAEVESFQSTPGDLMVIDWMIQP
jgi:hypothetical protein